MAVKKSRKGEQDQHRREALDKGWHLVLNYRREDPERHVEEIDLTDSAEEQGTTPFEVPPLLRAEMTTYQKEVLGWLEVAIVSWFNFYFAIGGGSPQERLDEASEGLGKATDRLQAIGGQMGNLPWQGSEWHDLILTYAEAVETWAAAIDLIMRGATFDRHNLAEEGFEHMNLGSSTAERVVSLNVQPETGVDVDGPLRTLAKLEPKGRISQKVVTKAKEPWERALVAAGSRLTWSKSVW